MSDTERLQAENQELRQQVEAYRQGELTTLREMLAEAKTASAHYRAEAERNAELGRQIHREAQSEIERLKTRVQALEHLPNARANLGVDQ